MVSAEGFRRMALAYPDATEQPHFEKASFRVGKRIFATYDSSRNLACVKLPEKEQDVFSLYDKTIIYPVPNKWGKQGWTNIELTRVTRAMLSDALRTAYYAVKGKGNGASPRVANSK